MKYLNVADFHFDFSHLEDSIMCGKAVAEAARKHEVDFILDSGDWWNRPHIASEKAGITAAMEIMKSWTDICPVAGILGTPSHQPPGSMDIFPGFILIEPDKVYGYREDSGDCDIYDLAAYPPAETDYPSCIIFGIPELNKNNIQAQLKLPAEQANAEALNLLDRHITEFIAPMRLKYKELPAIGLLHGNVTDSTSKEFETDNILKRSDILISTETLAKADLTIWHGGHLHNQWKSKKIEFEFGGGPVFDWKSTGFLPAFELVEIETIQLENSEEMILLDHYDHEETITRIPYGTPRREKVKLPFSNFENGVAYEIETDDLEYKIPENVHPWSRIKRPENKRETKRVSEEQLQNVRSLWDLFILADPDVPKEYKKYVDIITDKVVKESTEKRNIEQIFLQVKGCTAYKGKTLTLNIEELLEGLNCIHGANGTGKSFTFSFCSPFPNIIGKDTKSGRPSAIKDFFEGSDCSIEKRFMVNGTLHEHFIVIAKAHTQNPKVECSLTIAGVPQLDKGSFDEMFQECEKLYGLFEDFRITTFYEQPQQAKENQSGLMSCSRSDARNVVQHIADVDRESEKRFALDMVGNTEKMAIELESAINAKKEYLEDPIVIMDEIEHLNLMIADEQEELEKCVNDGNVLKKKFDILSIDRRENDKKKEQLKHKQELLEKTGQEIIEYRNNIINYEKLITGLESNKKLLADNDKNKRRYDELEKIKINTESENSKAENAFLILESEYTSKRNKKTESENSIKYAKEKIETIKEMINQSNKPCEFCGKVSSELQNIIKKHDIDIKNLEEEIKKNEPDNIDIGPGPIKQKLKEFDSAEFDSITLINAEQLQNKINAGLKAEAQIEALEKNITSSETKLKDIQKEISEIIISETIDLSVNDVEKKLIIIRKVYVEMQAKIAGYESDVKHLKEKLELVKSKEEETKEAEKNLITLQSDIEAWKYIAKMLSADKIPALELDVIVESIDKYATMNLKPFNNGQYSFKTSTQEMGKNSLVDKFDILIHDSETGKEQSIFFMNPGHKAFFSDSYVKALISKRNEKSFISYSPIILDEADGPIGTEHIPVYYDIQNNYFTDKKVLIVTHSSDAYQFIENIVEVEDLKS